MNSGGTRRNQEGPGEADARAEPRPRAGAEGATDPAAHGTAPLVVAIEGADRPASLAVGRGERVASALLAADREHASDLMPELEALCAAFGAHPRDLELIVVGLGPGSYTGLRVAAATGLGLALGSGAALVGVPSFEALALGVLAPGESADVLVDARGGYLYHACYRRPLVDHDAPLLEVLAAPSAVTADQARAALRSSHWIADRSALDAAAIDTVPDDVRVTEGARADAGTLLRLGVQRQRVGDVQGAQSRELSLEPLYLRPFTPHIRVR